MKKLINSPELVVEEMIEGLIAIHPGLSRLPGHTVVIRSDLESDRPVAVISGGGSGHEPAHAGYVGRGMLTAAVAGDVFTSPSPDAVLAAVKAAAGPRGALLIVKNYTGDRLNFGLAAEMARAEGIPVEMVLVADDVALEASPSAAGPRGLAGTVLVHKVAGAFARAGGSLVETAAAARAAANSTRTMGVALTPCIVPAAGKPGFLLGETEVEFGLGIHGEPGAKRQALRPADELVGALVAAILAQPIGPRVVLLVNNLGGTPTMELAIVARRAIALLEEKGLTIERVYVGTFLSALEMAGVSLSVMEVDDPRLALLDAPTDAPSWPGAPARAQTQAKGPPTAAPQPTEAQGATTPAGHALAAAIRAAAEALIANADRLTELDREAGDGDMGISLERGARAILAALPGYPLDDPGRCLHALGLTIQRAVGGTSGPLYAVFFIRGAARLRETSLPDVPTWAGAFASGTQAIADLGGAARGDRTMLDALGPAAYALHANATAMPLEALQAAAHAAQEGAEGTAGMLPRRGRASYVGERALGRPDPGAVAVAIWLQALADHVREETDPAAG